MTDLSPEVPEAEVQARTYDDTPQAREPPFTLPFRTPELRGEMSQ